MGDTLEEMSEREPLKRSVNKNLFRFRKSHLVNPFLYFRAFREIDENTTSLILKRKLNDNRTQILLKTDNNNASELISAKSSKEK